MKNSKQGHLILSMAGLLALSVLLPVQVTKAADRQVSVAEPVVIKIKVTARRYQYEPAKIVIPANRRAELHITSKDVLHGFYIPKLNIRADLNPGRTTVVALPELAVGEYPFACDIFCGSHHSGMGGRIVVH